LWPQRRHSNNRRTGGVPVNIIRIWHLGQGGRSCGASGSVIGNTQIKMSKYADALIGTRQSRLIWQLAAADALEHL
jgi:hypothetical protein